MRDTRGDVLQRIPFDATNATAIYASMERGIQVEPLKIVPQTTRNTCSADWNAVRDTNKREARTACDALFEYTHLVMILNHVNRRPLKVLASKRHSRNRGIRKLDLNELRRDCDDTKRETRELNDRFS